MIDTKAIDTYISKPLVEWRKYCSNQAAQPFYCELEDFPKYSLPSLVSLASVSNFFPIYAVSGASGATIQANNSLLPLGYYRENRHFTSNLV